MSSFVEECQTCPYNGKCKAQEYDRAEVCDEKEDLNND